jgi:hypothetical protein
MERLFRCVAHFGGDQTGNDECGDAVGVQVRRRTCSWRICHLDQDQVLRRLTRQLLLDDLAPFRGAFKAGPCCAEAAASADVAAAAVSSETRLVNNLERPTPSGAFR